MSGLRTRFEFVLPRGYLDESGTLHKRGTMRLATARDELLPLRDPTITGPDDPRLTILVLVRVVETLGTITLVTPHEIEGLFAVDLAYLQDFYGVINFGTDAEIDALMATQEGGSDAAMTAAPDQRVAAERGVEAPSDAAEGRSADGERSSGRRSAIQEVPSTAR